jgi:hypothetical protein
MPVFLAKWAFRITYGVVIVLTFAALFLVFIGVLAALLSR